MKNSKSAPLIFIGFILIAVGIGSGGYWYYLSQKSEVRSDAEKHLVAVAELKTHQIAQWRREREQDGLAVSENAWLARLADQFFRTPEGDTQELRTFLKTLQNAGGYGDVLLLDERCKVRLVLSGRNLQIAECMKDLPNAKEKPSLSDLHRVSADAPIHLDVIAPLVKWNGGESSLVGWLLFWIDPGEYLYPLIQQWPGPSESAETLLVERNGDDVLYLNDLRHRRNTALSLKLPGATAELPAAAAARGEEITIVGRDYRGVRVVAATHMITNSPWALVAKIDEDEVFAPLRTRTNLTVLLVGALILAAAMAAGLLWRQSELRYLRQEQQTKEELEKKVAERTAELKRATESLREKSQYLEAFFDHSITPLVFLDKNFNFIRVNEAYAKACKKEVVDFYGHNHFEFYPHAENQAIFESVAQTKKPHIALAKPFDFPDHPEWGTTYWDWTLVPVLREQGDIDFLVYSLEDVTTRKRAEIELEKHHADLERLVEQRTSQLRKSEEEARRANAAKDEFLATLSHELRTPLTSILGWTRMMHSGRLDAKTMTRGLEVIERNVKVQAHIIEDLLDVSRIIAGKLKIDRKPFDLAAAMQGVIDTFRPTAKGKNVGISARIESPFPFDGDPSRLQQVVVNLLSNAIKFTSSGGSVTVALTAENAEARIEVADTGVGVSPEFMPHLFQRFSQQDASTTRRFMGLGLGLAIVRHIVELHGGTVRAESKGQNMGTTIRVALPIVAPPGPQKPSGRGEAVLSGREPLKDLRILIAEDDKDVCDLFDQVLRLSGAEVAIAMKAAEAEALIERFRPDVLISDIGLPDEDGCSLLARIRQKEKKEGRPALPAIAVTGYAQHDDYTRVHDAGYQRHLAKPVDPDVLVSAIKEVLEVW